MNEETFWVLLMICAVGSLIFDFVMVVVFIILRALRINANIIKICLIFCITSQIYLFCSTEFRLSFYFVCIHVYSLLITLLVPYTTITALKILKSKNIILIFVILLVQVIIIAIAYPVIIITADIYRPKSYCEKAIAEVEPKKQIDIYTRGIKRDPTGYCDNPEGESAYELRADVFVRMDDYDSAIHDINRIIKLYPDRMELYYHRGYIYKLKGDNTNATKDFEHYKRWNNNRKENRLIR